MLEVHCVITKIIDNELYNNSLYPEFINSAKKVLSEECNMDENQAEAFIYQMVLIIIIRSEDIFCIEIKDRIIEEIRMYLKQIDNDYDTKSEDYLKLYIDYYEFEITDVSNNEEKVIKLLSKKEHIIGIETIMDDAKFINYWRNDRENSIEPDTYKYCLKPSCLLCGHFMSYR
jgi:hypothetical protein